MPEGAFTNESDERAHINIVNILAYNELVATLKSARTNQLEKDYQLAESFSLLHLQQQSILVHEIRADISNQFFLLSLTAFYY